MDPRAIAAKRKAIADVKKKISAYKANKVKIIVNHAALDPPASRGRLWGTSENSLASASNNSEACVCQSELLYPIQSDVTDMTKNILMNYTISGVSSSICERSGSSCDMSTESVTLLHKIPSFPFPREFLHSRDRCPANKASDPYKKLVTPSGLVIPVGHPKLSLVNKVRMDLASTSPPRRQRQQVDEPEEDESIFGYSVASLADLSLSTCIEPTSSRAKLSKASDKGDAVFSPGSWRPSLLREASPSEPPNTDAVTLESDPKLLTPQLKQLVADKDTNKLQPVGENDELVTDNMPALSTVSHFSDDDDSHALAPTPSLVTGAMTVTPAVTSTFMNVTSPMAEKPVTTAADSLPLATQLSTDTFLSPPPTPSTAAPISGVWEHQYGVEYPLDRFVKDLLYGEGSKPVRRAKKPVEGRVGGTKGSVAVNLFSVKAMTIRTRTSPSKESSKTASVRFDM